MAASDAFLAMQRWPMTCALEIAGLSRVNGTQKFLELVEADAIETNAIIHWGQRNNWHMKQVESLYDPSPPMGLLYRWREALSSRRITADLTSFPQSFPTSADSRSPFRESRASRVRRKSSVRAA